MSIESTDPELIDELQSMSDGSISLPQFATVMRGYDRGQVDDYVSRLNDFLTDAERRAERADRSLADALRRNERLTEELRAAIEGQRREPSSQDPYRGIGERIEGMLRLAAEEADSLRERGQSEAAELIEAAKRDREQQVQAAERELEAVSGRRDTVVAELRKVQDVLATLGLRSAVAPEVAAGAEAEVHAPIAIAPAQAEAPTPGAEADTTVIDLREVAARADTVG